MVGLHIPHGCLGTLYNRIRRRFRKHIFQSVGNSELISIAILPGGQIKATWKTSSSVLSSNLSRARQLMKRTWIQIFAIAVIILWIVVAIGTIRGAVSGELFYAPCLANLKDSDEGRNGKPSHQRPPG